MNIAISADLEELPYLPYTLDVEGYPPGECMVTELARSFEETRKWAEDSKGWIQVLSVQEFPEKIVFRYYDGMLRANSVRIFFKDMETCKSERAN